MNEELRKKISNVLEFARPVGSTRPRQRAISEMPRTIVAGRDVTINVNIGHYPPSERSDQQCAGSK